MASIAFFVVYIALFAKQGTLHFVCMMLWKMRLHVIHRCTVLRAIREPSTTIFSACYKGDSAPVFAEIEA